MVILLLALILLANVALLGGLFGVLLVVRRKYREFESFITPPEEGKPSPLAQFVDAASVIAARAIAAQVKTTIMGFVSGAARASAAVEGDIVEAKAQQFGLGAILESMPALKKTLRRNPGLADLAISKLGPMLGMGSSPAQSQGGPTAQGNGHSPKFKL